MADESSEEDESSSQVLSPVPPPPCLPDEWRPAISFFKDRKDSQQIPMNYNDSFMPSDMDWTDSTSLQTIFPCLKTKTGRALGQRQIPQALLLDAETSHQKLWVVNWWRSLSASHQSNEFEELRLVYRAPTKSNELFVVLLPLPLPVQETIHHYRQHKGTASTTITTEQQQQQPRQQSNNIPWSFSSISKSQELAEKLYCPVDALWCAEMDPTNSTCNVQHCPYPAILRNRNKCAWHRAYWYPRHDTQNRGYILLGPLYANRRQQLTPLCICNDETCRGIGYARDMVRVPSNATVRQAIVGILELEESVRAKFLQQTLSKAYLAPWHFLPQHRTMRPDGSWRLNPFGPKDLFSDDDENITEWVGFPPPSYPTKQFLETDLSQVDILPPNRQYLLPKWVHVYRTKEEGPRTMVQWQYEQSQQTEDRLLGQLDTWDARVETLELENYRLRRQVAQLEQNQRQRQHQNQQRSSSNHKKSATSSSKQRKRQRVHQRELEDEDEDYDDTDHEPLDHISRHRHHPLDESRHRQQQHQENQSRQEYQQQHHYHPTAGHPHPDSPRWPESGRM
jgi:hypothetical protein